MSNKFPFAFQETVAHPIESPLFSPPLSLFISCFFYAWWRGRVLEATGMEIFVSQN